MDTNNMVNESCWLIRLQLPGSVCGDREWTDERTYGQTERQTDKEPTDARSSGAFSGSL